MRTALATLTFFADPSRKYKTPADRTVSFIFDFSTETKLGALISSSIGQDFEPGTSQTSVRMEFWADDPWTDVVEPGASFTIWYGSDIGRGVIDALA